MPFLCTSPSDLFIIGYGNPQRRDDGIGPYVVKRLKPLFKHRKDVHLLILHQLEADIIDALKTADTLIFVDAAVEPLTEGRHWLEIRPQLDPMPFLIHQTAPAFILELLGCLYQRQPQAWMVSVEGSDFGFGTGLSPGGRKRAEHVIYEIIEFISMYPAKQNGITTTDSAKGKLHIAKSTSLIYHSN